MNIMNYKGYSALVSYSDEDGLFVGHIANIGDIVGFHAASVHELCREFEHAVDDYIDFNKTD